MQCSTTFIFFSLLFSYLADMKISWWPFAVTSMGSRDSIIADPASIAEQFFTTSEYQQCIFSGPRMSNLQLISPEHPAMWTRKLKINRKVANNSCSVVYKYTKIIVANQSQYYHLSSSFLFSQINIKPARWLENSVRIKERILKSNCQQKN